MKRRTWWNLENGGRKPNDYDIATTGLLYHPKRGFETRTPLTEWYARHGGGLTCADWDRFRDPQEMTYARYVEARKEKEGFLQHLLDAASESGRDRALPADYQHLLDRLLCPLRYPFHGLQMASAYLGSMAPGGRLAVCLLMQTADEVRRIQRIAYRMRQLQDVRPGFGAESRYCWELEPMWQPLRRAVERLLATYGFGEAFAALNLALKPALDEIFLVHFARAAVHAGDEVLARMLLSFHEDCRWQREWTGALARMLAEESGGNAAALDGWCAEWQPLAEEAALAFAPALAAAGLEEGFIRDGVRGALGLARARVREPAHAG